MLAVCQGGPPDGPRSSGLAALPSDAELSHCFFRHRIGREINSASTKRVRVLLSNRSPYDYINEGRNDRRMSSFDSSSIYRSSFVRDLNKRKWRKYRCHKIETLIISYTWTA